ncbi:DUF1801 domain-containing protein [Weissella diestrammenae]|uniref:DUF1801 domain-containing protein n=1 Tax=Weissella diestrammenae TaxID=1162633 RepID=A0A7G9T3I0_9LACO|nr:DUF1801 domain-containing protein [Weissella diestrammenae]MCM0582626.1 DUF1801 domain-containing protein [Weissella diestrammenae]QNN74655.1 DUF1801 domain-containing protein [Weissella diestrammenae]
MTPARDFETYFNDPALTGNQREMMQFVRQTVHILYPEVQERVAYAMPGFFPVGHTKATETLMLIMANKKWLGIYALPKFNQAYEQRLVELGLHFGKGSIQVPYDFPIDQLQSLLKQIIELNLKRNVE